MLPRALLVERDEPGRVRGSDTRPSVAYGLVGDGELAEVVSNHLGLDLNTVHGLAYSKQRGEELVVSDERDIVRCDEKDNASHVSALRDMAGAACNEMTKPNAENRQRNQSGMFQIQCTPLLNLKGCAACGTWVPHSTYDGI